jgi:hypothetical protein
MSLSRLAPYGSGDLRRLDFKILGVKPPPLPSFQLTCPEVYTVILGAHWSPAFTPSVVAPAACALVAPGQQPCATGPLASVLRSAWHPAAFRVQP